MAIQLERHLFTLDEYERMVDAGVFGEDARLEFIKGEIVEMSPVGVEHALAIARLDDLLAGPARGSVLVLVQGPLYIGRSARPEPDMTLLRRRKDFSRANPPSANDALLVVAVSDTSLKYDRDVKGPLYAEAGIPEYWIVNLNEATIEAYANPLDGVYRQMTVVRPGEELFVPGIGLAIAVSEVLVPEGESR